MQVEHYSTDNLTWEVLSHDVLIKIFGYIHNGVDLSRSGMTCWNWYHASADNKLWKQLVIENFGRTGLHLNLINDNTTHNKNKQQNVCNPQFRVRWKGIYIDKAENEWVNKELMSSVTFRYSIFGPGGTPYSALKLRARFAQCIKKVIGAQETQSVDNALKWWLTNHGISSFEVCFQIHFHTQEDKPSNVICLLPTASNDEWYQDLQKVNWDKLGKRPPPPIKTQKIGKQNGKLHEQKEMEDLLKQIQEISGFHKVHNSIFVELAHLRRFRNTIQTIDKNLHHLITTAGLELHIVQQKPMEWFTLPVKVHWDCTLDELKEILGYSDK